MAAPRKGRGWRGRTRFALAVALSTLAPTARADGAWSTSQAEELARQGDLHAASGDAAIAVRRYMEALSLDPSCEHAYLSLATVREREGDLREAERTLDLAIERLPVGARAMRERARLRKAAGRADEALSDLEAAARLGADAAALRELAQGYVQASAWPAALATWRRIAALPAGEQDARSVDEARRQIRALGVICGELDPVRASGRLGGWERRALASIARRRGE